MKFLPRLVAAVTIICFIAVVQISPVKASPSRQELTPNPLAEEYIKTELLADGDVDLKDKFVNENERMVSAEFIVSLWKDPTFQEIPFFKIRNATIVGDIKAEGILIPFNVEFWSCRFDGRIEMSNAKVQAFNMYDSVVTGAVRMGRVVATGDLSLYNTTYESAVVLFDASISGSLLAKDSKFNGTEIDAGTSAPFELWKVEVGQATEFTNAVIKGDAKVDDARFNVDVKFDHATFEKPASFKNIQVGNLADFQYAVFNEDVTFESSIMERDAKFTGGVFNGEANFDYLAVTRFFDFDQTTLNKSFSFQYPVIGWPYFEKATFNGTVNFEGMQASNDFDFTNAAYNFPDVPFTVALANVAGAAKFEGFTAPAGLSLEHNQFGDLTISAKDKPKLFFINLDSTKVDGDLTVENIETYKFTAEGVKVANATAFRQVTVTNELDISNADLGFFTMEKVLWPKYPESFNLRGMTYTDIGLVNQELNDDTWNVLLKMVEQSAYSPQAYRTLALFLTEKGHPDWAADVELNRKLRERDQILTPRTGPWFWSWFLYIFSGYGQRPQYAFGWSLLVIIIGAFVFRSEQDLVILDASPAKPVYNPLLYSFALFLPYIDLGIASKWDPKPERKFAGIYKHIHRLLGWILMPIALLTFGGIIK